MSRNARRAGGALLLLLAAAAEGQEPKPNEASPEMARLLRAFEGSYTTVEHHQPHRGFPNGGVRNGTAMIRPAAGGNAMLMDVQSTAPQGDLDYTGLYWWDPSSHLYRVLMCARQFPEGCITGATARWEDKKLVRTHQEDQGGKKIVLREGADSNQGHPPARPVRASEERKAFRA